MTKINQFIKDIRDELKIINDEVGCCQQGLKNVDEKLAVIDVKIEGVNKDISWIKKISWYSLVTAIGVFVSIIIAIIVNAIK